MAALFFDLDGTLLDWNTDDWMPGAIEMLRELKQQGNQIIFMTFRGHSSVRWEYSIERTTPLLEKLGIEYQILFGVESPRIMFDDSPTYGVKVEGAKTWQDGEKTINEIVRRVEQERMPGMVKSNEIRVMNTEGITKARFEIVGPNGEAKDHCEECHQVFLDEDDAVTTLHITRGEITLCEECCRRMGNDVR